MSKHAEVIQEDTNTMLDIYVQEVRAINKTQPGIANDVARVEAILPSVVKYVFNKMNNPGETNGNNEGNSGKAKGRNNSSSK